MKKITNKQKAHMKKVLEEFSKELKKLIDESADKTDIWDNERWDKFRNILRKEINKLTKETILKHCGKPLEED